MDEDPRTTGSSLSEERTPEVIRADIEQTRAELGDTVEALAEKTDVKARAHERVEEIKETARAKVPDSPQSAVATARANPVPVIVGACVVLAAIIWRRSSRP
jgi:hypothetical protein